MFTCYVIDDDVYAVEVTAKQIARIPELSLVGSQTNPILGLEEIKKTRPDLVFLDVEMPRLSGIELADLLPKGIAIVYITSHPQYALTAFQKDAVDFLLKPFSFQMFVKCVDKVLALLQLQHLYKKIPITETKQLLIKIGASGKIAKLEIADIVYVEALNHYVCIHTIKEKYVSHLSMLEIEEKLKYLHFARIHKKHLINIDAISFIEHGEVELNNGLKLPVGETYKKAFFEKLEPKMIKKIRLN